MDQARENFQIAGFQGPIGLGWIANMLLELGIYAYVGAKGHWYDMDKRKVHEDCSQFIYTEAQELPCLFDKKEFSFEQNLQVEYGHMLPSSENLDQRTILWYRNVYGWAYSNFMRREKAYRTLENFLQTPYTFFGLSPQDEWALYYLLWLTLAPEDNIIVSSYDNGKKQPVQEMAKILSFLSVKRGEQAILNAAVQSKTGKVLKRIKELNRDTFFARKGDPDEYKEIFSENLYKYFSGLPEVVLNILDGTASLDFELFDIRESLKRIESMTQSKLSDRLTELLAEGMYYDARLELRKEFKIANRVIELAFNMTWKLLSSSLYVRLNYARQNTIVTFKVILYALSSASIPYLVYRQAILNMNKRLSWSNKLCELTYKWFDKRRFGERRAPLGYRTPVDFYIKCRYRTLLKEE